MGVELHHEGGQTGRERHDESNVACDNFAKSSKFIRSSHTVYWVGFFNVDLRTKSHYSLYNINP